MSTAKELKKGKKFKCDSCNLVVEVETEPEMSEDTPSIKFGRHLICCGAPMKEVK